MGLVTFMMQYLIPLTLMSFSYVRIIFQLKMLSISYIRRKRQAASNSDAASQAAVSQVRKDAKIEPRSHSNGVSSGTVTEVCISTSSRARSFLHATLTPIGGATNQSMTPIDTTFNQSQSTPRYTFNQSQSGDDESLPQVRPTRSPTLVIFEEAKYNATRTLWFVFIYVYHLLDSSTSWISHWQLWKWKWKLFCRLWKYSECSCDRYTSPEYGCESIHLRYLA